MAWARQTAVVTQDGGGGGGEGSGGGGVACVDVVDAKMPRGS